MFVDKNIGKPYNAADVLHISGGWVPTNVDDGTVG